MPENDGGTGRDKGTNDEDQKRFNPRPVWITDDNIKDDLTWLRDTEALRQAKLNRKPLSSKKKPRFSARHKSLATYHENAVPSTPAVRDLVHHWQTQSFLSPESQTAKNSIYTKKQTPTDSNEKEVHATRNDLESGIYPLQPITSNDAEREHDREKDKFESAWKTKKRRIASSRLISHDSSITYLAAFKKILLRSGYAPLIFRLINLTMCITALALAGSITRQEMQFGLSHRPSTILALLVNSLAIIYLPIVTWDEYFGQTIGMRSPKTKLRLMLLDLFAIVLNAADVALAFSVLYDTTFGCLLNESPQDPTTFFSANPAINTSICRRQQGLTGVLLTALFAWLATFTVSLYRLVEKMTQ